MDQIQPSKAREIIGQKANPEQLNMIPERDGGDFMCVLYHTGDYRESSLAMEQRSVVIIDGDLDLDGGIVDCSGLYDDFSLLIVLGSVRCRNLASTAAVYIHEDLSVSDILYYNSFGECTLEVQGALKAGVFAYDENQVIKAQSISGERVFKLDGDEGLEELRPLIRPDLQKLFDEDFEEGFLKELALVESALST